jgi:hypothetical protein
MGSCRCGWRTTVSFYEADSRDAILAEIDRRYADHVTEQLGREATSDGHLETLR